MFFAFIALAGSLLFRRACSSCGMEPGGHGLAGGHSPLWASPPGSVNSAPPLSLCRPPKKEKPKTAVCNCRGGGEGGIRGSSMGGVHIYIYYKVRPLQRAARAGREQEGQGGERGEEGGVSSLKEKASAPPLFYA